jgi:hypothetical protein
MADVFLLAFRRRSRKSEADSGYKPVPGGSGVREMLPRRHKAERI